jgi:hypothetical protein
MQGRNQVFGGVFRETGVLPDALAKAPDILKEIP